MRQAKLLIIIFLLFCLCATPALATTPTVIINQTNYSKSITGPLAANNSTVMNFSNNNIEIFINDTIPASTDNYDPGAILYDLGYQFQQFGAGDWFIIIIIGTLACIMLLSQNGSPFLPAMVFMVGNSVLWGLMGNHADWLIFFSTVILLSLALAFVGVLKGRG